MRPSRGVIALVAAWVAGLLALVAALEREAPLFVNLGAGDRPFASGFHAIWERDGLTGAGETMFHWTEDGSRLQVPVDVRSGSLRARLRLARFAPEAAEIALLAGDREVDRWVQEPLGWRVREVDLGDVRGPLALTFRSKSAHGDTLGVALDWVEVAGAQRIRPEAGLAGRLLLFLIGVPLTAGLVVGRPWAALELGALLAWVGAAAVARDRLGSLVAIAAAGAPAVVAVLAAALLLRRLMRFWPDHVDRRAAAVALPVVALSVLALSHPFYYYPDVDTHLRLFQAMRANPLLIVDPTQPWARRGDWTREIGGRSVAIPYAVVFHALAWPLVPILGVVPALKALAAISAGVTIVLVHALARSAGLSPPAAIAAQILAASMPVLTSRLSLALYPTLFGQAMLVLLLVHLVRRFGHLDGARDAAAATLFVFLADVVYTGSLVMVAILVLAVVVAEAAAGERRRAVRLLGAWAVGTSIVAAMYVGFLPVLWRDVLPAVGAGGTSAALPEAGPFVLALRRLRVFFDTIYPALLVPGVLALRSAPVHARRIVMATLSCGAAVLVLRYVFTTLLRDAKEVELLLAPVAVAVAAGLDLLWRRGAAARALAAVAGAAALGWGIARSATLYAERFVSVGR